MAANFDTDNGAGAGDSTGTGRLRVMFRALESRNFRLFFGGQGLSLIGTWMTMVATGWLVYRLTESTVLLGVVGFCGQVPAFFLAPFTGVVADRWDRHRLLLATQSLAMLQALTMAFLVLSGRITMTHIILLSLLHGVITAFDIPARQAFLSQMIEHKEDLSNAIALNSSMFNAARLVGPSIAAVVITKTDEGICFLVDGISYVAVIAALLAMRVPARPRNRLPQPMLRELREGLGYVIRFWPILYILLLIGGASLVGFPYTVLLPAVAKELLGGEADTFGFLTAAAGLGALCGALYLASRRTVIGLGLHIVLGTAAFGLSLVAVALSRWVWLSLPLMVVVGFSMMTLTASCNTVLQTIVDEDKRGRVLSLYMMAFIGTTPFGSLLAGVVAERFGVSGALLGGGVLCVALAIWFARALPAIRRQVRPIYVRLGILPEIASGMQAATSGSRRE
ncbi:MAG: MFS transporter [Phycisphaerae bacterium]